jgi:hypothetical protein
MAYEYSSESGRLDFPNPYRIENIFLFIGGSLFVLAGLYLLLRTRSALGAGLWLESALPLILSVALMAIGIRWLIARAFSQLRFYFGRGQPAGLAPELAPDETNAKFASEPEGLKSLKVDVRGGQLPYEEPKGAMNGLLYKVLPKLIYAPIAVRRQAEHQFRTGSGILLLFLSFAVAVLGANNAQHGEWIATIYLLMVALVLFRSLMKGSNTSVQVMPMGLIALAIIAVLGPVLIPYVAGHLPDIAWLSPTSLVLLFLLAALIAVTLVFVALLKQCPDKPQTAVSSEQIALSMNADPTQLLTELDREMQRAWVEKIPNRRYALAKPVIDYNSKAGNFQAELLEETQPLPPEELKTLDASAAFAIPRYRWLTLLDLWGLIALLAGGWAILWVGLSFNPSALDAGLVKYFSFGAGMLILGGYSLVAAHRLWGRFDFASDVTWVQLEGNYSAARVDYGNTLTDRLKTERNVINVEGMTLRVWCTRLASATFGKESVRVITGLTGLPDKAKYLAQHLGRFADNQSMIVSPTASADLEKVATMNRTNQLGETRAAHAFSTALTQGLAATSTSATAPDAAAAFCVKCGTKTQAGAKFCHACGAALSGV